MKKLLSLTAMIALVFSMNTTASAGATDGNPTTCAELGQNIIADVDITLTQPIDCASMTYTTDLDGAGTGTDTWGTVITDTYTKTFNGAGYTISNLAITTPASMSDYDSIGLLMGSLDSTGSVINLNVTNSSLTISENTSDTNDLTHIGGLIGLSIGEVTEVNVDNLDITINDNVGGSNVSGIGVMIGKNAGTINKAVVINSSINIPTGEGYNLGGITGGLIKHTIYQGTISNSYTDNLSINAPTSKEIGGITGYSWDNGTINNTFASNFTITGDSIIGGIVGTMEGTSEITSVYAQGTINVNNTVADMSKTGSLVGMSIGTTTDSNDSIGIVEINMNNANNENSVNNVIGCTEDTYSNTTACTPITTSKYATGNVFYSVDINDSNPAGTNTYNNLGTLATTTDLNDPTWWEDVLGTLFPFNLAASVDTTGFVPTVADIANAKANGTAGNNGGTATVNGTTTQTHTFAPSLNIIQKIKAIFA